MSYSNIGGLGGGGKDLGGRGVGLGGRYSVLGVVGVSSWVVGMEGWVVGVISNYSIDVYSNLIDKTLIITIINE